MSQHSKNKGLFLTLALVAFAATSFILPGCKKAGEVKVGVILPLSGDGAKYGEEAKNAIEIALKEDKDQNIKAIYEDDLGTANGAISAFNKLTDVDKVPIVIGPMYSSTALAIAPLGEKKQVVILSPSASSPDLTEAGDYFFRNWPSDVYEGGEMAKLAYNDLGLKTVAIISVNLDYGVGLTRVFERVFESLGGEIVAIEYYDQGATDFRTQLSKVKTKNPDAIYLPGYYTEIGLVLKQAKEMGVTTRFLSCVGFDNPKILEIAGESAEGVIFARPFYNPESQDPHVAQFVEKYTQKYGIQPGVYAGHAYDAFRIIASIIKDGASTSDEIKKALYAIENFPGVTGNTSFDENGDVVKPIQIMHVVRGEFNFWE